MLSTENKQEAKDENITWINYSREDHFCKISDRIELHLGDRWVNWMFCLKCDLKKAEKEGIDFKNVYAREIYDSKLYIMLTIVVLYL